MPKISKSSAYNRAQERWNMPELPSRLEVDYQLQAAFYELMHSAQDIRPVSLALNNLKALYAQTNFNNPNHRLSIQNGIAVLDYFLRSGPVPEVISKNHISREGWQELNLGISVLRVAPTGRRLSNIKNNFGVGEALVFTNYYQGDKFVAPAIVCGPHLQAEEYIHPGARYYTFTYPEAPHNPLLHLMWRHTEPDILRMEIPIEKMLPPTVDSISLEAYSSRPS